MQLLTKEDIRAAGGIAHSDGNVFFTNIEQLNAAILAKLGAMELPEPAYRGPASTGSYFDAYTAAQLTAWGNTRYAQGAAAQLAEKPFGFVRSSQWHFGHVACDESDEGAFALYTRREAK